MNQLTKKKIIVGLDIGTTKVVTLIGEISPINLINIIGIGISRSHGIEKGEVTNLKSVSKSIQSSIELAENMAGYNISSVYLSISSKHIHFQNEIGIVPLSKEEVTEEDIKNVIHTAQFVKINNEHEILHVIPKEFAIDQKIGIKNPLGLSGIRMQVEVHLITCHNKIVKNFVKSVQNCGIKVDKIIYSGLASKEAVISKEEKKLGVCIIDIGSGTMDVTTYVNGSISCSFVIPYAGNNVTNDISSIFSISKKDAEIIKIENGCSDERNEKKTKQIEIISFDESKKKYIDSKLLQNVIEARYLELLNLVKKKLLVFFETSDKTKIEKELSGGIILTGGASKIKNLINHAKKIFKTKVKIGKTKKIEGLTNDINNENYSTVIGLLKYGKKEFLKEKKNIKNENFFQKWFKKIHFWIKKEF
ncbi:cell division protein FtsA [Buchnera aphidicola (Mindarus keteleerifoliae)]|uniref:cell division protein FtsA n=1 Tax=Buchnera aphidicola TaxID=9 RepID=UPI0031B66FB6